MSGTIHLKLTPECGICICEIRYDETVVAIYRTTIITITTISTLVLDCAEMTTHTIHNALWERSPPFRLSRQDLLAPLVLSRINTEIGFCYDRMCSKCTTASEAVACHRDCYEVLAQTCRLPDEQVLLRRLLARALGRKPWKGARPLFLPRPVDKPGLNAVAAKLGLPQLSALPVELVDIITDHSADAFLWRGIAAWRLARHLASMKDDWRQPQVMGLREIVSWERGGELVLTRSQTLPPFVRLTLDSDGISRVERLGSHPRYSGGRERHTAYIVASVDHETLRNVRAQLSDGQLRLHVPADGPVPHIWNTPTPPPLSSCRLLGSAPTTWSRLFAIDSASLRGITFFYNYDHLCNIHIHYPGGPSAQSTHDQMSYMLQRKMSWLYLPLSGGDRLTVLGARPRNTLPACILAQSEKAGNVLIGPCRSYPTTRCQANVGPLTFIYGEPKRGSPMPRVELIGTYCEAWTSSPQQLPDWRFALNQSEPSPFLEDADGATVFFTWAPLEDVASAVVFRDELTGYCRGILFRYLNGGSRAIGQCRLQVDESERFDGPTMMCVLVTRCRRIWHQIPMVCKTQVVFQQSGQEHDHGHMSLAFPQRKFRRGEQEWRRCFPMRGEAQFWFTADSAWLGVVT